MEWSAYQNDIFAAVAETNDSLIIEAVAGSGKTTTIVEAISHVPQDKSVIFLAFNKSIADELGRRVKQPNASCKTLHALGFSAWRRHLEWDAQDLKVDGKKTHQIVDDMELEWGVWNKSMTKLVGLAKGGGLVPKDLHDRYSGLAFDSDDLWEETFERYDIDPDEVDLDLVREVLTRSIAEANKVIDFDDMLYMPVIAGAEFEQTDVVFLDEAQDVNGIQAEIVSRMLGPESRVIAVGDPNQCQPGSTLVVMEGGFRKPLRDVRHGDKVVSYDRHASSFVGRKNQGRRVLDVYDRPYVGEMFRVGAGFKSSECTLEHKWLTRFNENAKYLVYLMLRGEQGRIGIAQAFYDAGFGPAARARSEGADSVWVLSAHKTRMEAWLAEQVAAAKFGLPQIIFELNGQKTSLTQEQINYALLQIGPNLDRVQKCLEWHGRDLHRPLWVKGEYNYVAARRPFVTAACNLIPEIMSLLSYDDERSGTWLPLTLERFTTNTTVYSLKVEDHELYVADGLLTHNSIYGFRGAMHDSMSQLQRRFGCRPLPLSVSYRCPKRVVAQARQWVSHILHHEAAPEGLVESAFEWNVKDFKPGDAILCRNSVPVVSVAFLLIRNKIAAKVVGRDIGQGLVALVNKMKARTLLDLDERLDKYRMREVARAKGKESKIAALDDKIATIRVFMEEAGPHAGIGTLVASIESMFGESGEMRGMVTCSTVHKAKGLEFNRVFVLDADLYMPSRWARQPWELQQEDNLCYVAATRAKRELRYISTEGLRVVKEAEGEGVEAHYDSDHST